MKKKNKQAENNTEGDSKTLDDYVQLYTQIVREISENLKNKREIVQKALNNETNLYKTLEFKKRLEHPKSDRKLF
ncbi:MAG: hypothetical protein KAV01_09110 [Candidatus Lokiarchaeota archaeon]|nr:hypothetical protein [Candidatus Lokiarchaeota archaeon]